MDIAEQILLRPDLQATLGGLDRPDDFLAAVSAMAGGGTDPDHITEIYHDGGVHLQLKGWPPKGWLPIGATADHAANDIGWAWFGAQRVYAPFFDDAARAARYRPINRFLRISTTYDAMVSRANGGDQVPLSGLIFHMSRCGSTLLSNMLGAVATHRVYAEPQPLDMAIAYASKPDVSSEKAIALVRAVVAALGRKSGDGAQRMFIKCDAWHVRALPLLRAAFPDVPWLYLFRDPLEVIASHSIQPGRHVVAGIVHPPLVDPDDAMPDQYVARALQVIGDAVVRNWSLGGGLAIEYGTLVNDGFPNIARHFGLDLSDDDYAAIHAASRANAKFPDQPFSGNGAAKQSTISDAMRKACEAQLQPLHAQLLRLAAKD